MHNEVWGFCAEASGEAERTVSAWNLKPMILIHRNYGI